MLRVFPFAGTGVTPQEAADIAAAAANAFLATHQWRDTDGRSVYTKSATVSQGRDGQFFVIITLIGPCEGTV